MWCYMLKNNIHNFISISKDANLYVGLFVLRMHFVYVSWYLSYPQCICLCMQKNNCRKMMRVYHCKAYIVSYRGYGPNPRNLIDIQNPTWPPKRSCFVRGFRVNFSFTKLVMNLRCQSEETNAMSSRNPKKRREQKSSNDSILLANMEIFMIQMIKRWGAPPSEWQPIFWPGTRSLGCSVLCLSGWSSVVAWFANRILMIFFQ